MTDWRKIVETQHGIIAFAEEAAQILAEAGLASQKALGDPAEHAARQWSAVILQRTLELLREDRRAHSDEYQKQIRKLQSPTPKVIDHEP